MNTVNDDDLLNAEDEFDYEDCNLDLNDDQEEELLQDDFPEATNSKEAKIRFGEDDDDDEEEDVLTLGLDDEERFDKSLVDDSTRTKDKPTKSMENNPKPIPTTTNNVNSKKISSAKPWDRPPPTTKTLTSHEKNLNGRRNERKINNSWRGGNGGRGSFNSRPRSEFQKRRNGTVLINPRYKGTVPVSDNARLAWDVNSQPPANYIQPWASGVPTSSNNPSIQNTLVNLVSHLRNSADVTPNNTFNSNMPLQQNDYFQAPLPVVQRNVFEHPPVFQQTHSTSLSQVQPTAPVYGQTQLPYNTYGGADVQNQSNRHISNDRLQVDNNNRSYNDQYSNSYRGRNENFQSDYSQPQNNYYSSNYRNQDNNHQSDYNKRNESNYRNQYNNNKIETSKRNSYEFENINIKNVNNKKQNVETNYHSDNVTLATAKKPRLQVISSDCLYGSAKNNEQGLHKRIMFEENRSPIENVAKSQSNLSSMEDEEMRLYRLKIEEQKRLREEVLRRKEENRKKVAAEEQRKRQEEEEFLKRQEEERLRNEEEQRRQQQERLRNQQELQRRTQQIPVFQQVSIDQSNFLQRVFSAPKVPPLTICRPKFEPAAPKLPKFDRPRENITIIPTDDFTNRTFTIKNNLSTSAPTTPQSSNAFRTDRVVTMKNPLPQKKHVISPWANALTPGVDSSNLTFSKDSNTLSAKDPTKGAIGGGGGNVDEQFSSFLNNRKVLKSDKHFLNTRLVTISNLSASTDERKLESLTQGIGEIQWLDCGRKCA